MASDLDALDDALATSTGKFRPKVNKFQAKKPLKSSATVDHINQSQNESSSVSQISFGGPSRVGGTDGLPSSDLDALDAALTTDTGHVTSKFMPKAKKFKEKRPLKPSLPMELINVQNNNQSCSVSLTDMQVTSSQVGGMTSGVLTDSVFDGQEADTLLPTTSNFKGEKANNSSSSTHLVHAQIPSIHGESDQTVSLRQTSKNKSQGLESITSSSVPPNVVAKTCHDAEGVGEVSLLSSFHGTGFGLDAYDGGTTEPISDVPYVGMDAAASIMKNPFTVSCGDITLEMDAVEASYASDACQGAANCLGNETLDSVVCHTNPNTDLNQVENMGTNPDTGSSQIENTGANLPTCCSEDLCSDLDAIDDVLATSLPAGRGISRFQPKNKKLVNRRMVTPQSAGTNSTVQKTSGLVGNDRENSSLASPIMGCDLDILEDIHTDSASLGQKISKFRPKTSKLCAKRSVATPSVDPIVNTCTTQTSSDAPLVNGGNIIFENPLHGGEANQQAAALQEDGQVSDVFGSLEERSFVSSPFSRETFDHGLEGEPFDPTQAGLFSMNNEPTENVGEDGVIPVSGLEGDSSKYTRSSRRLSRQRKVINQIGETHEGINDESNVHEASGSTEMVDNDDDDDEDFSEKSPMKGKRIVKGKKKRTEEPQPTKRKVRKTNEGLESPKKEHKKKFSHSTRRTRTLMDQTLLEIPEDEIDPRRLVLKDLILLADIKERRLNKAGAASRNGSATAERDGVGVQKEADLDGGSTQSPAENGDKTNEADEPEEPKLNYHSFMTRTPSERWSEADNELFYKAIRQFGTDFEMIQKLFPGRTRRQVKLKYKKEERKHPLELADALVNRSKDHTHFQLVIDQLQSQAQAESKSCKSTSSPEIDGQNEEYDDQFGNYNNLDTHEAGDVGEWSHEAFDTKSPDYVPKDDYSDYNI